MSEIRTLENAITAYSTDKGSLPNSLDDIGYGTLLDPWGNHYQYRNAASGTGLPRKDKWGNILNSDYDIYSNGLDGVTAQRLDMAPDDIVRASEGSFVGQASLF